MAYKEPGVYSAGPGAPIATVNAHTNAVRVHFRGCTAGGITLHETVGFEVSGQNGSWRAAAVIPNAAIQAACAIDLDPEVASARANISYVRYNWFRSTCFANVTTAKVCGNVEGCGAGRCAVYSGAPLRTGAEEGGDLRPTPEGAAIPAGLPAPPFSIEVSEPVV